MKLIGLEEHWCPRELFEKEGTPGYESMMSVKNQWDMLDNCIYRM